jgi:hypothetical protein
MKKEFISAIIGVLIIISIASGFLYFSELKSKKRTQEIKPELKETKLVEKVGPAKWILNWLNNHRDERGAYLVGEKCFEGKCTSLGKSNRAGFSVLWARYKYFQSTKDEKEMEILKSDIDLYSDKNKVKELINNFWNCYFLYPIWKESTLETKYKEKIEKICFESVYDTDYYTEEEVSNLGKSLNILVDEVVDNSSKIEEKIKKTESPSGETSEDPQDIKKFFVFASDHFTRYLWRGKVEDLKRGILEFEISLAEYKENQEKMKAYEGCQTGIASLLYYLITKNQKYLTLAQIIAQQQNKKIDENSQRDVSVCGLLFEKLYEGTNDYQYLKMKRELISKFIQTNFKPVGEKEGYFFTKSGEETITNTRYNGILAGVIIE